MHSRNRIAAILVLVLAAGLSVALPRGADADSEIRVTAVGDIGTSTEAAAVLTTIGQSGADAAVVLGDLAYNGDPEQAWCDFVKARTGDSFPFQLVAGNHESNGQHGNINNFSACLPNQIPGVVGTYGRQYYYDLPRSTPLVRVINVSAGLTFPDGTWAYDQGDARYRWTATAIDNARAAGIPWVIVATHYPCLGISGYGCEMPEGFLRLLEAKRVDVVLNGHDHAYMRTHQLAGDRPGCPQISIGSFNQACVADADNSYRAGQGTVFATVGTGGQALRPVNRDDTEYGYFAAATGSNANPTWGVLDLTIGADELRGHFTRSTGGDFADDFTLAKVANQAPVAAFTTSASGLRVTADATASTDADGTIAQYQWDFGDSTTGTGRVPAPHTYPAAGTYRVTLTVTDDAGATASTSRDVTVTDVPTGQYVRSGDSWRFLDGVATAPANWAARAFVDTTWKQGPTQAGYGDGDEATTLSWGSNAAAKPITSYARRRFDAGPSITDVTGLDLRALVDDAAVVYLNGTEIWRFNLPAGAITSTTRASRFIAGVEEQQWRSVTLPVTALRAGENVIAVEVHQDQPSSSDLSLDLELRPRR